MTINSADLEARLLALSNASDWHGVIEVGGQYPIGERTKFLWAWPSIECLEWLKRCLTHQHIRRVLSIGCGSGLLEWLIEKSTAVPVTGLELDKSWWQSAYSPKTFVELRFTDSELTSAFLADCASAASEEFALLFCYFNSRDAFLQYMRCYGGNCVIIVGPMSERHVVTDPNPLSPRFEDDDWTLFDCYQFNDMLENCMSVYVRAKAISDVGSNREGDEGLTREVSA